MLNMTLAQRGHKHYFVLLGGYTNGDQESPAALWLGLLLAVLRDYAMPRTKKTAKLAPSVLPRPYLECWNIFGRVYPALLST